MGSFLVAARELLVVTWRLLVAACGIQFPDEGLNLGRLHWERGVLATGPPVKSQARAFLLKEIFLLLIQSPYLIGLL